LNGTNQSLQTFAQQCINGAFLDVNGNPLTFNETTAKAMEARLLPGVAAPALQDTLFGIYKFMQGESTTSQAYKLALTVVQFAFAGQTFANSWPGGKPINWQLPGVMANGTSQDLIPFLTQWFTPPSGVYLDDPYMLCPGVDASDFQTLFSDLGYPNYPAPTTMDTACSTAWNYLQNTILASGGPGSNSVDAALFNQFILTYQQVGSQQGVSPPNYIPVLRWVNSQVWENNFSNYPGITAATIKEFNAEISPMDANGLDYMMCQDTYMVQTQWMAAHPAQNYQEFGKNLLLVMQGFLNSLYTDTDWQTQLSYAFFINAPEAYPGPPGQPNLQFSDLLSLMKSFQSLQAIYKTTGGEFPNFPALVTTYTYLNANSQTMGPGAYALFQNLAQEIETYATAPDLSSVIAWMKGIVFDPGTGPGQYSWSYFGSPVYTWPADLSQADMIEFCSTIGGFAPPPPPNALTA
jgi:hypothetical protein